MVGPLSRDVLAGLVEEYTGALLVQGYNPINVAAHKRYLERFVEHVCGEWKNLLSIDHACLLRWMQKIRLTGVKEYSLQANKTAASGFYKWLIRLGKAERNPIEMLAPIRLPEQLPKPLPVEDTLKILERAKTKTDWPFPERNRAMLEVLYASGIRRTEIRMLDVTDLHIDGDTPYLMIRQGKGKRDGLGMLTPSAVEALKIYLPTREKLARRMERPKAWPPLFLSRSAKRLDHWTVGHVVDVIGLEVLGRHIHPHQFRHSFCTDLLNRGANLMAIKELARHKQLTTTQKYLAVSTALLKEGYSKHPRAGKCQ